jgi:hypothetical protein
MIRCAPFKTSWDGTQPIWRGSKTTLPIYMCNLRWTARLPPSVRADARRISRWCMQPFRLFLWVRIRCTLPAEGRGLISRQESHPGFPVGVDVASSRKKKSSESVCAAGWQGPADPADPTVCTQMSQRDPFWFWFIIARFPSRRNPSILPRSCGLLQ